MLGTLFTASVLRMLGNNPKSVRRGLRVLYNIYNGNIIKIGLKTPSVMQTMQSISNINDKKIKNAFKVSAYLSGFIFLTSTMITPLILIGTNFIAIRISLFLLKSVYKNLTSIVEFVINQKSLTAISSIKKMWNVTKLFGLLIVNILML